MTTAQGTSGYVRTNDGVQLHYLEYSGGSEPAVVIVPGITSPAATWAFMASAFADEHHVVTLDARGRGLSDKPKDGFSLPRYAEDVVALVTHLGLEQPTLLGHSMGARVAAAVGVLHPASAGKLILVDPPLTGPGRPVYPISLETFEAQLRDARNGATADDMQVAYPHWDREHLELRAQWLHTCDETAIRESWLHMHSEDFFAYLRELPGSPTLVYGERSPVVPPDSLSELRAANPRLELVCVPRSAHMIPWENAEGFEAAIRSILKRIPA